jgi:hypothetical protein
MDKIIRFFSGKVGILLLGFILTTGCGAVINWLHTRSTWNREKRFELLTRKLVKHEELLTSLSTVVGARVFRLQRVLWALEAPSPSPPGAVWQVDDAAKKRINDCWNDYYLTVIDWNLNYRNYATRIRFLAGPEVADNFFVGDASGARRAKTGTVAGSFEQAHEKVKELRDSTLGSTAVDRTNLYDQAKRSVDHLYNKVDSFVAELYSALDEHARSDNPLEAKRSRN